MSLQIAREALGNYQDIGHCLTSYDALGIPIDRGLVQAVVDTAPQVLVRPDPSDTGGIRREARATSADCKAAAMRLAAPVVKQLFQGEQHRRTRQDALLFGVNYYESGDTFPPHRDFNIPEQKTVIVISLSGRRTLHITDDNRIVYDSVPDRIVLLDGMINPEHMAKCTEGTSVSVAIDVPASLRWDPWHHTDHQEEQVYPQLSSAILT